MDLKHVLEQYNLVEIKDKEKMKKEFQVLSNRKIINNPSLSPYLAHMYEGLIQGREVRIFSLNDGYLGLGWGQRHIQIYIKARKTFPVSYKFFIHQGYHNRGLTPPFSYKLSLDQYGGKISKKLEAYSNSSERENPDQKIIKEEFLLQLTKQTKYTSVIFDQNIITIEKRSSAFAHDIQSIIELAKKAINIVDGG